MKFGIGNLKALHFCVYRHFLCREQRNPVPQPWTSLLSGTAAFRAALLAGCFQGPGLAHEPTVRVSEGLS